MIHQLMTPHQLMILHQMILKQTKVIHQLGTTQRPMIQIHQQVMTQRLMIQIHQLMTTQRLMIQIHLPVMTQRQMMKLKLINQLKKSPMPTQISLLKEVFNCCLKHQLWKYHHLDSIMLNTINWHYKHITLTEEPIKHVI